MTLGRCSVAGWVGVFLGAAAALGQAPPGFAYQDPLGLGIAVERIKGDRQRTFKSHATTLQAAHDLGMVRVSEVETQWGAGEDLVTLLRLGGIGLPRDGKAAASLDITFTDAYTDGRTLETVTIGIGGDIGTRNLYDFDLLYSTTAEPDEFRGFFSASDGGPNPPNLSHANKSPCTELRVSGFRGAISDLHTLRLVARDATNRGTNFGSLTLDLSPVDPEGSIAQRLARLARVDRPREPNKSATITVAGSRVHTFSEGMGWNIYMHDGVPAYTDRELDELAKLLEWSGCEWVRAPVVFAEWELENDNDDPYSLNWDAFRFDRPKLSRAIRIWRRLDTSDIDVLVCNWKFQTKWMSRSIREAPDTPRDEWLYEMVYSGEEIGESYAALIMHLERNEGIDNVRAVSIINEPDGSISRGGYGPDFWALYPGMARVLRHYELLDRVEIVGPEFCGGPASLARAIEAYGDILPLIDVVSDHFYAWGFDYVPGFQPAEGERLYAKVHRLLAERLDREPRLVQGEFGASAGATVTDMYAGSLSLAEQFVRNVNVGLDGQLRWNWGRVEPSDKWNCFRPLLLGEDGRTQMHGPVFYPQALVARYIRSGWDVMRSTVTGGRDEDGTPRVWAACFRSPGGDVTLLAVNDGFEPKQITLNLDSATRVDGLNVLSVSGPKPAGIDLHPPLKLANGSGGVEMQPRSIYAITSLEPGDLDLPKRVAGAAPDAGALYETALASGGNAARLQHVLAKARRDEDVTMGVIGGSITGGAAASSWAKSYGPLVADWWRETFPASRIKFINAGVGGTGSIYGALRAQRDLFTGQPDFVITEFAVNDSADRACTDAVEGLTRQVLSQPNNPANLMLFMVHHHESQARNVQAEQIPIGEHYGLPMISFRDAVRAGIEAGRLTWEGVLADTVHPNDVGHRLAADLVIHHLEAVRASLPADGALPVVGTVPGPLGTDAFEHVALHEAGKTKLARCEGWQVEDGDWRGKWWTSSTPGGTMELVVAGQVLTVYTNRNEAHMGVAEVVVDGGQRARIHGWFGGDILSSGLLFRGLGPGSHTVCITLLDETWPRDGDHTVRIYAIGAAAVPQ